MVGFSHSRMGSLPDEDVVLLAREGEPGAAELLCERYRALVVSKARYFYVSGADREDVFQEGMIGLCKAIRDYRLDHFSKFKSFAEICVTRQIISAMKSATRNKHVLLSHASSYECLEGEDLSALLTEETLEEDIISRTEGRKLQVQLAKVLSRFERAVLVGYAAGRSYKEMSEGMHCPTKSIDNALQRAKKKMKQALT